jgi:hypothetical protein
VSGGDLTQVLLAGLSVGGTAALSIISFLTAHYFAAFVVLVSLITLLIMLYLVFTHDLFAEMGILGGLITTLIAVAWYFFYAA